MLKYYEGTFHILYSSNKTFAPSYYADLSGKKQICGSANYH